jgi:hypothetical protein
MRTHGTHLLNTAFAGGKGGPKMVGIEIKVIEAPASFSDGKVLKQRLAELNERQTNEEFIAWALRFIDSRLAAPPSRANRFCIVPPQPQRNTNQMGHGEKRRKEEKIWHAEKQYTAKLQNPTLARWWSISRHRKKNNGSFGSPTLAGTLSIELQGTYSYLRGGNLSV